MTKSVKSLCHCGRAEVSIPIAWVGVTTGSCDHMGCVPGCTFYDEEETDLFETEHQRPQKRSRKMAQFNPSKYDPVAESTPGLGKSDTVVLDLAEGPVLYSVDTGKFQPGHDARLKGILIRAQAAGAQVEILNGNDSGLFSTAAQAAAQFSTSKVAWSKMVADRGEALKVKVESKPKKAAASKGPKTEKIKIGRWEYEAVVESVGQDGTGYKIQTKDGERHALKSPDGKIRFTSEAAA